MEFSDELKNELPDLWTILEKYDLIKDVEEELFEIIQMTKQQKKSKQS